MCGIVGYIGQKKVTPILIDGLSKLEYRGYDSAGIATIEKDDICIIKNKGRVKDLSNIIDGKKELEGMIGIAHTRWATHGEPSDKNSHPHSDNSKTFAVVHNGIVENYKELKSFLESKGYEFISQTDSEVIPNLIHYYYGSTNNFLEAVNNATKDIKGSYAIEVISKLEPNRMIVARKDSPLVVGKGDNEVYIASDIPAILEYTKNFYILKDNEIAEIYKNSVKIYDKDLNIIERDVEKLNIKESVIDKGKYSDFMIKEINEQPEAIIRTVGTKLDKDHIEFEEITISKEYLLNLNRIYIIACGTAMHAGLATKKTFEKFCKIPTEVDVASEFRYRGPLLDEKTLCIFISQSGETADTIAALKLAKRNGAKTIAISNVIKSSITREADYSIYTCAGAEIAVASTKAYTSQVVVLTLLAMYFGEVLDIENKKEIEELKKEIMLLPEKIEEVLKNNKQIEIIAKKVYSEKDMFFIGRGVDYATSLEGSLKLKEISYIHSESYSAGELKHGPIALIEKDVTVVAIVTDQKLVEKTVSNIQEVITRGAKSIVVTNQKLNNKDFDIIVRIPQTNCLVSSILAIIPLQLLAYYISKEKGLDVDKPRNLAKSVTVE